jgi:hypothetical protein
MNVVTAAALGALAISGGVASAADNAQYLQEQQVSETVVKTRRPLMMGLEKAGLATALDDAGIDISGHIEVGYTWSFSNPPGDVISGRYFEFEHDDLNLDQISVIIGRSLTATDDKILGYKDKFNVGFKTEFMYGKDARLIHSNGLFDWYADNGARNEEFDLTQAYVELGVPVGNGLLVTVGKFLSPIGYETINPTTNQFYSHSYMFGYSVPFTHTGVQAKYNFTDSFYVSGGVNRGWEQSLEDNNGDEGWSFLGSVGYTYTPGSGAPVNLIFNAIAGPEQADTQGNWRLLLDFIASTTVGDQLTLAVNAEWAYEDDAAINGNQAQWYGIAGYAGYKITDMITANLRAEWFNDKDGARGIGTNAYEVTAGVSIRPMPNHAIGSNLVIRPEVRYDYAQESFFDGGTDHDQLTASVDAIFTF